MREVQEVPDVRKISIDGNDHVVLVAAIVYDDLNPSTVINAFDNLETHSLWVNESNEWQETTFSTYYSTEFQLKIFESDHNSSTTTWTQWLKEEGKDILKLNDNWSNTKGTRAGNHGFDMLAGFVNILTGNKVGIASINMFSVQASHLNVSKVYLHEIFHTYMHASDRDDTGDNHTEHLQYCNTWAEFNIYPSPYIWNGSKWIWNDTYRCLEYEDTYIMHPSIRLVDNFHLHPTTEYYTLLNVGQYDGFE